MIYLATIKSSASLTKILPEFRCEIFKFFDITYNLVGCHFPLMPSLMQSVKTKREVVINMRSCCMGIFPSLEFTLRSRCAIAFATSPGFPLFRNDKFHDFSIFPVFSQISRYLF